MLYIAACWVGDSDFIKSRLLYSEKYKTMVAIVFHLEIILNLPTELISLHSNCTGILYERVTQLIRFNRFPPNWTWRLQGVLLCYIEHVNV